jgi:urease accessory protein
VGAGRGLIAHHPKNIRGARPFVFTNLKTGQGLDIVLKFIETEGMLCAAQPQ